MMCNGKMPQGEFTAYNTAIHQLACIRHSKHTHTHLTVRRPREVTPTQWRVISLLWVAFLLVPIPATWARLNSCLPCTAWCSNAKHAQIIVIAWQIITGSFFPFFVLFNCMLLPVILLLGSKLGPQRIPPHIVCNLWLHHINNPWKWIWFYMFAISPTKPMQ